MENEILQFDSGQLDWMKEENKIMSLEKEARRLLTQYYGQEPDDTAIAVNLIDLVKFILETQAQQTKEKLKRCEELASMALKVRNGEATGKPIESILNELLTQLKDNG